MTSVHAATAAMRRKLRAAWVVDLTDPVRTRAVRAQIIAIGSALALAVTVSVWVGDPTVYSRMPLAETAGVTGWLGAVALYALRRRERIADTEFFVLMITQVLFGAVTTWYASADLTGIGLKVAMGVMPTLLVGAIFCGRRWHSWFLGGFACVVVTGVAAAVPAREAPLTQVGSAFVALPLTAWVVRFLRDQSVRSLHHAHQGEVTDPLTGLANRRGLERSGVSRWEQQARAHRPLALLVIDVDHFKRINDTQGHAAGDAVLRRLAEVVSADLRSGDLAVRMGGEEFLVLCDTTPLNAAIVAERLRATIERELAPVTVSIGVHVALPEERQDPLAAIWSAVDVADRALYSAKSGGRNRVATIEEPVDRPVVG